MLLKKVRLSFPALFKPTTYQNTGVGDKKYEATFLIEKGSANHKMVEAAVDKMNEEDFKGKLSSDRLCLKDGDDKEWKGFEGHVYVKTSSKRRPPVVDRDKSPIQEEDDKVYGGCYVNANIELWAQKGQWGNRVNAGLRGVQFDSDGERFVGSSAEDEDEFIDYEEEVSF
jgi:hypothetical protein